MITVITPTTGKQSLFLSIESLKRQNTNRKINHIVIWDNKREGEFLFPTKDMETSDPFSIECNTDNYSCQCIVLKGNYVLGNAKGSALRAIGLMAANTDWVTFMDDDVMWDKDHLESIMNAVKDTEWGFSKRKIWTPEGEGFRCIGIDEFESVGEEAKTDYKMVDNNSMVFKAKYGYSAACMYRNTTQYNDDRLMYKFLMEYGGTPAKSEKATVNQICPKKLIKFFEDNCTKE